MTLHLRSCLIGISPLVLVVQTCRQCLRHAETLLSRIGQSFQPRHGMHYRLDFATPAV